MTKRNNHLEERLFQLFSTKGDKKNDGFLKKIESNTFDIKEKDEEGKFKITFRAPKGHIIRITESILQSIFAKIFSPQKNDVFNKICDGIFFFIEEDSTTLCLVELKKTINSNFPKAITQIEASYLKMLMLLNVFEDFKNIKIKAFIGGNFDKDDYDLDIKRKIEEFMGDPYKPASKLHELINTGKTRMNFPFKVKEITNPNFHKKNVEVIHMKPEEEFHLG